MFLPSVVLKLFTPVDNKTLSASDKPSVNAKVQIFASIY